MPTVALAARDKAPDERVLPGLPEVLDLPPGALVPARAARRASATERRA
ncbi:hypothetical protein AB0O32_07915 [Streptomyces rubiginosohelvolus]